MWFMIFAYLSSLCKNAWMWKKQSSSWNSSAWEILQKEHKRDVILKRHRETKTKENGKLYFGLAWGDFKWETRQIFEGLPILKIKIKSIRPIWGICLKVHYSRNTLLAIYFLVSPLLFLNIIHLFLHLNFLEF